MYVFAIVQADAQADARRRSAHSLEFEAPPWRRRGFRAAKCKAAASCSAPERTACRRRRGFRAAKCKAAACCSTSERGRRGFRAAKCKAAACCSAPERSAPERGRRGFRAAKCKAAAAEATTSHCSNLRPDSAVHTDMLCSFLFVLFAIRE